MKVIYFEAYPGFRGAQRSLANLVEGLGRLDVDPHIWCTTEGKAAEGFRGAGLPTRVLAAPGALGTYGGDLARQRLAGKLRTALVDGLPYTLHLLSELRSARPALLHCNQARGVLLASPAARLLGIPLLWHQRGLWDLPPRVGRLCHYLSSGILCVSEAVRDSLPRFDPRATWVVHNGIDPETAPAPEAIARARRHLRALATDRGLGIPWIVATASSPIPYKGLHHLVGALALLLDRRPELADRLLWLALGEGGGPPSEDRHARHLRRLVADRGLERHVVWYGWSDDPLPWLAAADAVALPTVERETLRYDDGTQIEARCSEGLPRTVLEAMLVETPIIASRVSGVPEQIRDGESGLLVPPSDPEALADGMIRLIEHSALAHRLAENARRRLEHFDPMAVSQAVRRCYEDLL